MSLLMSTLKPLPLIAVIAIPMQCFCALGPYVCRDHQELAAVALRGQKSSDFITRTFHDLLSGAQVVCTLVEVL